MPFTTITAKQHGKCMYYIMSSEKKQDAKVSEKFIRTKAERKYSKIKIVVGLEWWNCGFIFSKL